MYTQKEIYQLLNEMISYAQKLGYKENSAIHNLIFRIRQSLSQTPPDNLFDFRITRTKIEITDLVTYGIKNNSKLPTNNKISKLIYRRLINDKETAKYDLHCEDSKSIYTHRYAHNKVGNLEGILNEISNFLKNELLRNL